MQKKIWLYVCLIGILLLVACSDKEGEEAASDETTDEVAEGEENKELEDYIGETIDVKEDGSITFPFDEQVLGAAYSENGDIMLLGLDDYVVIVEEEEIIHVDGEAAPDYHFLSEELAVSEDGKFATWRVYDNEDKFGVFDVDNQEVDFVESPGNSDIINIFSPHLIEKHDDTYYLMTNDYWAALNIEDPEADFTKVVDLNELEIKKDKETIEKVSPKEPVEDDDVYHDLKADAAKLGMEEGPHSDYGYFRYFYEAVKEGDDIMTLKQLYGSDVEQKKIKEIEIEDVDIENDGIDVMDLMNTDTKQIQIADNGMLILPIVDGDVTENDYTLRIYSADISEESPFASFVTEIEVTDEQPTVFFNEDNTAIYLSTEEGLEKFDVKD